MAQTRAGIEASRRYNLKRRLDTLRHAILEPLLNPPLGFADVVQHYFSQCRQRILVQAKRWVLEARGSSLEARYEKVFSQLVVQLRKVALVASPLAPREEDVTYLQAHDPVFYSLISHDNTVLREDRKPAATERVGVPVARELADLARGTTQFNPWGNPIPAPPPESNVGLSTQSNPWANPSSLSTAFSKTDSDDEGEDDFYS